MILLPWLSVAGVDVDDDDGVGARPVRGTGTGVDAGMFGFDNKNAS